MSGQILLVLLMPLVLRLAEVAAAAKFRYIAPNKAGAREIAKVPAVIRVFVHRHNAAKYGSALVLWGCVAFLYLNSNKSVVADFAAHIVAFFSIVVFAITLTWRMYIPVR